MITVVELAVLVQHLQVECLGVLAAELEDVAHLDASGRLERVPAGGHASPARTSAASMVPSAVKSRPATRSMTCWPGLLAPVTHAVPDDDAGVEEVADPAAFRSPHAPGPM